MIPFRFSDLRASQGPSTQKSCKTSQCLSITQDRSSIFEAKHVSTSQLQPQCVDQCRTRRRLLRASSDQAPRGPFSGIREA
jgi:hypothetical protein